MKSDPVSSPSLDSDPARRALALPAFTGLVVCSAGCGSNSDSPGTGQPQAGAGASAGAGQSGGGMGGGGAAALAGAASAGAGGSSSSCAGKAYKPCEDFKTGACSSGVASAASRPAGTGP